MDERSSLPEIFVFAVVVAALILIGAYFIPWSNLNWGKVSVQPAPTITVSGQAKTEVTSQIASFNAGVSAVNDRKDAAVADVNKKMSDIIAALKNFGIAEGDIKTQNLNIYQQEESYYEDGRQKSRPGQWRVNNSVDVKLRDINRASDLANLLSQSGATNVSGPNFTLDDTSNSEAGLLENALKDAQTKAEKMAAGSGRKLGKLINVVEGGSVQPGPIMLSGGRGGGGAPVEPGSGTVSKSVTATFELQ